jgi:hypothetical protein
MTHFEQFKNLSAEEMATKFEQFANCVCYYFTCQDCPFHLISNKTCTKSGFTLWLNSEVEEMSNLTPNNGWISVNDNLPDSPRQVLIYTDFGGILTGCYDGDTWFSYGFNTGEEGSRDLVVTHWRELPDQPRMEERID